MHTYENEKQEKIIKASFILMVISIALVTMREMNLGKEVFSLSYKSINIKDISAVKVSHKKGYSDANVYSEPKSAISIVEEPKKEIVKQLAAEEKPKAPTWLLPVERGTISSYPRYGHVAYDITSPRGVYETIYPIAEGTISGIYTDVYGGKVITIHHVIDGINYTSQYVHFASYASGLYVGKKVTIYDSLGQMGATGWATGVHLHVALLDCSLFDSGDQNCSNLGGFFNYSNRRYNEGFTGLGNFINVPWTWSSR